jgi:hypothetical protein
MLTIAQRRDLLVAGICWSGGGAMAALLALHGDLVPALAIWSFAQAFLLGFWKQSSP